MGQRRPLGTTIRRARERRQWTQQQLANLVGVNRKTIDNWENDRSYPRNRIGALEYVLGIRLTGDVEAAAIIPRDAFERSIIDNPTLSDENRELVIRTYRRQGKTMADRFSMGSDEPPRQRDQSFTDQTPDSSQPDPDPVGFRGQEGGLIRRGRALGLPAEAKADRYGAGPARQGGCLARAWIADRALIEIHLSP